jgi:hypothetical protein
MSIEPIYAEDFASAGRTVARKRSVLARSQCAVSGQSDHKKASRVAQEAGQTGGKLGSYLC